jgi:hypothetical protein
VSLFVFPSDEGVGEFEGQLLCLIHFPVPRFSSEVGDTRGGYDRPNQIERINPSISTIKSTVIVSTK